MTINTGIHQPIAAPKPVDIGHLTGLTLNVPEWFADPEFCEWLNRDDTWVFTWHEKGTVPSDFPTSLSPLSRPARAKGVRLICPSDFGIPL